MKFTDVRTVILVTGVMLLVATAGCSTVPFGGTDGEAEPGDITTPTAAESGEEVTPTATDTQSDASPTESESGAKDRDESSNNATAEHSDESDRTSHGDETTGPIADTGLRVDENRVYNLTRDLLGSDADAPTVSVEELNYRSGQTDRPFFEYMGLTNESDGGSTGAAAAAVARGSDSVVVNEEAVEQYRNSTDRFGLLLAHEFTHTVQMDEGWSRSALLGKLDLSTSESLMLYRSLVEGGAVFTADQYADSVDLDLSQVSRFDRQYDNAPVEQVYAYAPYHHGGQYFESVLDSASELGSVYTDDTPPSTEAILHPTYNDTEPSEVAFSAETNREGWTRQRSGDDRLGALFVHVTLTAHEQGPVADEATKGWGNDQLFQYRNENGSAFAWATHWDTTDDATEFAEAFNRTLTSRTDDDASDIGVRRAGNRSVVVLAGPQSFRDAIAVDGENNSLDIVLQQSTDESARAQIIRPSRVQQVAAP